MELFYILSLAGVAVFSISGALASCRKNFDLMGLCWISLVTALGGGTFRDLLLDTEVFWIKDPTYIVTCLIASFLTALYSKYFSPPYKSLLIADGLGLALFSISGAQAAELLEVHPIIIVIMGLFTGVLGGILRDVLCQEIPVLFKPDVTLYGTTAISGIVTYLILQMLGINRELSSIISMLVIAIFRFLSMRFNITLPKFSLKTTN